MAKEVVGEFTVIYVEAKAGVQLLTAVVEEAQQLGGPVLLILEDVDLWCRDRASGPGAGENAEQRGQDASGGAAVGVADLDDRVEAAGSYRGFV
ncbi:hypothetical protein [Mycobacterium avium]|uniref:hypothetical protein n=1 Tax=Mycobacterium avium TaxID=1764 RepID=UPI001E3585FA|nr:hypothetical protein [Mycobacterium avium]